MVNPSTPVRTLPEFIAYLKQSPGKYTYSSGGFGTPAHLLGELFKLETGVRTQHVPYQSNARAIADIINGTNTYQFRTAVAAVDMVESGKLKALVAMSRKRVPAFKDVPTIIEAGYPKLASEDWAGILAKAGTPAPVVARLNVAFDKALKTSKVRDALTKVGADRVPANPHNATRIASQVRSFSTISVKRRHNLFRDAISRSYRSLVAAHQLQHARQLWFRA